MLRQTFRPLAYALLPLAFLTATLASRVDAAPPVLTLPGPQSVSEGQLLAFDVSATDPDGQSVFLQASNLPTGASFTDWFNNTGTFDWTPAPDQAGFYEVYFLADDTFGGTDVGSVQIEVLNANSPPVLSFISDRDVEKGTTQFVSLNGYDADGDALRYSASGLPSYATLTDFGDGTAALTLAPTAFTPTGPTTITVFLSDGLSTTSQSFTVTVTGSATNGPPVLATIGNRTVAEGATAQIGLSATDPDGDALTWSVSLPGFASLTPTGTSTATLTLSPGYCQAGAYPATVAVSDATAQDSESFTITVTEVNRAPVWSAASYSASVDAGGSATVSVAAHDPDQACNLAAPALSVKANDGGSALLASLADHGDGTGTLSLSAASGSAGSYHVTLRASDGSLGADVVVNVTVNGGTQPPVAARAWAESDPLRLNTGKPRERVYLEPVEGTFALAQLDAGSIRLFAWDGAGSVSSIAPVVGSLDAMHDRDNNGVIELRMDFAKDDLRALFSNLSAPIAGTMVVRASLDDGREVSATVSAQILPENLRALKRVGPNPMNPQAVLTVDVPRAGRLRVRVFDLNGRLLRTLVNVTSAPAGMQNLTFDGRDDRGATLSSGRYFVRVETDDTDEATPITILK